MINANRLFNTFLIILIGSFFSIDLNAQEANSLFFGHWKFSGYEDANGVSIPQKNFSDGPLIVFEENGNYSMRYSPFFVESGKWFFDSKEKKMFYRLKIDENSNSGKYLIENKIALYEDGVYWDEIKEPIKSIDENKLIIQDTGERYRSYKKLTAAEISGNTFWSDGEVEEFTKINAAKNDTVKTVIIEEVGEELVYSQKENDSIKQMRLAPREFQPATDSIVISRMQIMVPADPKARKKFLEKLKKQKNKLKAKELKAIESPTQEELTKED